MIRFQFILFFVLQFGTKCILAQVNDSSNKHEDLYFKIRGEVIDLKKNPLDFVTLVLLSGGKAVGGAKTDQKGIFIFDKIRSGSYNLKLSYAGFMTSEIQNIVVNSNMNLGQFKLEQKVNKGNNGLIYRGCYWPNPPLINRHEPNQKIILRKEMKQMGY